jgi:hypothetical protein
MDLIGCLAWLGDAVESVNIFGTGDEHDGD